MSRTVVFISNYPLLMIHSDFRLISSKYGTNHAKGMHLHVQSIRFSFGSNYQLLSQQQQQLPVQHEVLSCTLMESLLRHRRYARGSSRSRLLSLRCCS